MLGSALCYLHQVEETLLALLKACDDGLLRKLREVLVLNDKVM
jgi:hypothetical protein